MVAMVMEMAVAAKLLMHAMGGMGGMAAAMPRFGAGIGNQRHAGQHDQYSQCAASCSLPVHGILPSPLPAVSFIIDRQRTSRKVP